jgi:RHS repeat-associated protein
MRYYAFGETRLATGTMFTDRLYTSQRFMPAIGLYHYGARFYSPSMGRFISADTIVSDLSNPQNLNRFSYVLNNPLRYTDPTGHDIQCTLEDGCWETCDYNCTSNGGTTSGGTSGGSGNGGGDDLTVDMELSDQGEDLIKYYEDYREYPYPDEGLNCTIGWGHVLTYGEGCSGWPNKTYGNGITRQQAQEFFDRDVSYFEDLINDTIIVDLTQAQFDALVSYTFNTGDQPGNWYLDKGIPELINSGDFEAAASIIRSGPLGTKNTILPKVEERRQVEADLFLYGIYGP